MKKTRKKRARKMDKYAMGSGNTGVIKGYMPNPSEVFRQNQIDLDKAKYEAASNPFVQGLDILGGITTQAGISMFGKGIAQKGAETEKVDNTYEIEKAKAAKMVKPGIMDYDIKSFAMGTGPEGAGKKVIEAEKGEIVKSPDGSEEAELGGKKHSEGGTPIAVEPGTKIFSDQLKVGGKTMADREKIRANRIGKLEKILEKDPTDKITKESYERTKAQNEYEEKSDLMIQGYAKSLDGAMDAAMGTGVYGTDSYANGTGEEGVEGEEKFDFGKEAGKFFGGFTPGDYMGLAGNLYSGITGVQGARRNAANDTPNQNFYEGYADEAIQTIEEGGGLIKGQQAQAGKDIKLARTKSINRGRNSARGVNQVRALDLASDVNANKAMGDMYESFSKLMMDNLYKKAGLESSSSQVEAGGKTAADIANRQDKDNADTQLGVAQESMGRALQMTGKDLNANKKNRVLTNLTQELSKHGLKVIDGKIVQG